ncbi:MAG TPA: Calx-beta domain-containing protein, partial [Acidimicrobiales bacterium]|nr:Calx-beta domain-containing protein [Acidimicrobiales bacterium]
MFRATGSRRGRIAIAAFAAVALVAGVGLPRLVAQANGSPTVDVNPAPTFTNHNANVTEGNFGNSPVVVTFALSQDNTSSVTVHYTTGAQGDTATNGVDYVDQSGDVVFAPHETSKNVVFNVKGDTIDEGNEVFTVALGTVTNGNGGTFVAGSNGTVTIQDDDAAPGLSLPDTSQVEGNTGDTVNMKFTASLSAKAGSDQTFYAFTHDPTNDTDPNTPGVQPPLAATAGTDYTALAGTPVTIHAGDLSADVLVPITPDTKDEFDEWVELRLKATNDVNAANVAMAEGKIVDDDALARLDVADPAAVTENDTPCGHTLDAQQTCTVNMTFTVTLTPASNKRVVVDYATADRTATSGSTDANADYIATSGSGDPAASPTPGTGLEFMPGETSKTVTVPIRGDNNTEGDESFVLNLSNASNAAIGDGQAQGLIHDDDTGSIPTVSVSDAPTVSESGGPSTFTITVNRPPLNTASVPVCYQTADGPQDPATGAAAVAGSDYTAASTCVTINALQTTATVTVPLVNDTKHESDEYFQLQLTGAGNASITDAVGQAKITDDDAAPTLSIADKTVTEGNTGLSPSTAASLTVTLSAASGQEVDVDCTTPQPNSGNATADTGDGKGDYVVTATKVVFAPGETSKTCDVPVVGDTVDEDNETVDVQLTNQSGAGISDGDATLTITDDDNAPTISIGNTTVTEGSSTNTTATFGVSLSNPSSKPITVHVATADGTAKSPGDYTTGSANLTFDPGATRADFDVTVIADTLDEPNETFTATISSPNGNATLGTPATGTATIIDDDDASALSIDNATVTEGNSGTTNATFHVTLAPASGQTVTVHYATADGTATQPDDYTATSGDLTFNPGDTTKSLTVPVKGDTTVEPDEGYTVTLSSPTNATISDGTGNGTITNDDTEGTTTTTTPGETTTTSTTVPHTAHPQITTGAGPGGGPHIQSFSVGSTTATVGFMDGNTSAGKRVARGDVTGDGVDEIITGSGPGDPAVLSVYSATGQLLTSTFAYAGGQFRGGVFVAAGDIDGDGVDEIITGAGPGGGPHVIVWKVNGQTLTPVDGGFFAYSADWHGGVTVATGDVTGDGKDEIITGPGAGGGPDVEVTTGTKGEGRTRLFGFMAYIDPNAQPNWNGGVNVAAGDVDGDGKAEIAVVPWSGGGPHLRLFNHDGTLRNGGVMVGSASFPGGLTVAMGDLSGDGHAEIVVGVWTGTNRVKVYTGDLVPTSVDFKPYGEFGGGNFVA